MDDIGSIIPELHIEVTKTSDGARDYVQVRSADQLTINLVLLADKITISDLREPEPKPRKKTRRKT